MNETLSQLIRSTKEYSYVCDTCKDEILIYPTISGRTDYSQDEVEQITLKKIIDKLQAKEQECDKLKFNLKGTGILGLMKRNVQLKKALDEIEKICQIKEENSQFVLPSVWQQILDIINKVKESE